MKHLVWRSGDARGWWWLLAALVLLFLAGVFAGWFTRPSRTPLAAAQAARVKALAEGTGSARVWRVYEAESRHGLTREGAEKVREAAKAMPPPYGLISARKPR